MLYVREYIQNVISFHVLKVIVSVVSVLMRGSVGLYTYIPPYVCVHLSSVHGVCTSICLELVCVFVHFLCIHTLVFVVAAHRCGVGLVCLCAHVCAGAGKRVHLRYGAI